MYPKLFISSVVSVKNFSRVSKLTIAMMPSAYHFVLYAEFSQRSINGSMAIPNIAMAIEQPRERPS